MRWPQFSLLTLAALVAFAAVASAALVYASQAWSVTLFSALVAWLSFAVLAAIYRQAAVRAFWIGCAVCGWIYMALLFWPASERQQFGAWYSLEMSSELATTRLAHWLYDSVLPKIRKPPPRSDRGMAGFIGGGFIVGTGGEAPMDPMAQGMGGGAMPTAVSAAGPRAYPDEATFVRVAHAVFAWMACLIGGAVGRRLFATQDTSRP